MNNLPSCSKSKQNEDFGEDEIFDDSSFLAKLDNSFKTTSKLSESYINDSINKSALNVSALCCDEEISGYDKLTGKTWIYPTNYSVRDYQFNIIRAAILKNTLVSLPTGLGKTFIAAVIMYNFYRWYPLGKIVFTAPTRPLVAQQIEACYNIIAIPPNDTIEMTGHMQANTRKAHWQNKRVFFATPQVVYNDMKSGICPCDKIRCLVVDEAHRARGNYAYCQIVSALDDLGHKIYRMLALSATPGSKVEDVVNVVKNLHIAHLELRTENCIDVAPYSHARKISTVVIQLGPQLTQLRQQYVEIMDGYARRLIQFNILPQNLGNLSKGRIVMLYKEFQSKERGARHPQHNYIMKDFTILIALYHGLELLSQHGSRVFLNFFDEHPEKSWIQSDDRLTALLERLRDDLGINPMSLDRSILPDGTIPEIPNDLCFGHPKFNKLKEIMLDHFTKAKHNKQDTKAIVFCEYRESVNLVHCLLLQCRPLIQPQMFVGQGASGKDGKTVVSQKQQLRVMRAFRDGACNTLVATCVAEEGLDVGSVDLILCFDISTRSPIRLVQRCGRTGRERGGHVYILVTEGREHQTLMDCMRQRDGLNKKIQQSKEVENNLYKLNPRMMPRDFTPQCQKMFITVEKKQDPKEKSREDKVKKGQKDLRSMLLGRASSSSSGASNKDFDGAALLTEDEFKDLYPDGYKSTTYFGQNQEFWAMSKETLSKTVETEEQCALKLSTWLEWQRTLQKTVNIGHTRDTEILSELLQYSDAKRFEMPPSTQNPCFYSQETPTQKRIFSSPVKTKQPKKKQKVLIVKSPAKRDGDIRALFSTATKSTTSYTKLINDLGIQNDGNIPTRLISLLVDLTLDNTTAVKKCYICQDICECSLIQNVRKHKKRPTLLTSLIDLKLPDIDLIDDFDADSILKCAEGKDQTVTSRNTEIPIVEIGDLLNVDKSMDVDNKDCTGNFDLEFDFGSPNDFNSPVGDTKNENVSIESDKNFEIGDIEDIFADSSPEEAIENETEVKEDKPKEKVALEFFGLDSIDDIFADDDIIELTPDKNPDLISKSNIKHAIQSNRKTSNKEHQLSPSILSGKLKTIEPTSPILCSQVGKFQLSRNKGRPESSTPFSSAKRQLIKEPQKLLTAAKHPDKSSLMTTSVADTSNKSMFTITQLVEIINKSDDEKSVKKRSNIQIEINEDNRSTSPILLTQADRKKPAHLNNVIKTKTAVETSQKSESLIVLDSDSDSDNTQIYDPEEVNKSNMTTDHKSTPINCKRKLDMEETITSSPYFCKKQKMDDQESKKLTLQEKVLAAVSCNKFNKNVCSDDKAILNFSVSQPSFLSQKENKKPTNIDDGENKLERLQIFRRDRKVDIRSNSAYNRSPQKPETPQKRKLMFDDSDDDFVIEENNEYRSKNVQINGVKDKSTTNHKVRKKKNKKGNEFLDMEAAISDDDDNSGDELSDDSVGSIADFICDQNLTHHEDIQAVYLKSIKSPIKGGAFKIPELPKKYHREDILSQYVEDDTYEMDSFCVDSHIGLTQVNDVSELELAEIVLEEERQAMKKTRKIDSQSTGSPVVKRNKPKRRRIDSDSDDSS